MASREHRLHHWLWHEVRNSWLSYPDDVRQQIRDLGWEPPRPALDERRRPILDNDAGEDFLYMHRQMLIDVSRLLARINDPTYPRVRVWTTLPPPGDREFPVPAPWFDPTRGDEIDRRTFYETIQRLKSDVFYQKRLVPWQKMFTDPAFLPDVSLGELGALMEQSIHASMHMRWAASPAGFRPDPGPAEGHTIDPLWDDPRYDHLGDTYSSHVNVVFWSLHGWVDDRVEDWKVANGVYGANFWKGTWVGKMPTIGASSDEPSAEASGELAPATSHRSMTRRSSLGREDPRAAPRGPHAVMADPHHDHSHKEELEKLVAIIGKCGVFHGGYTGPIIPTAD